MVRHRSDSSTSYRASKDAPETPLTPRTPRSPHFHRSRLMSPTLARPLVSLKREHVEDSDLDLDPDLPQSRSIAVYQPNAKPTPSELLSMDLNTLALRSHNTGASSGRAAGLSTPSARLSDADIGHLNLRLPFERILGTPFPSSDSAPSYDTLESVHRYPTRTPTRETTLHLQRTPTKTQTTPLSRMATPPSTGAAQRLGVMTPSRSNNSKQIISDEENNLFLTHSPRAVRTPRRMQARLEQSNANTLLEKPVPVPDLFSISRNTQASDDGPSRPSGAFGDSNQIDEDDVLETESVLSSAAGDYEKENHTPKFPDDMTNPFFVGGGTSELKRPNRPPKLDGSTTPTGTGSIIRSRRLALGSISPWRWNTFDEQVSLAALYGAKSGKDIGKDIGKTLGKDLGKDLGLFSADGLGSKSGYAISEWIESADHSRNTIPSGDSGGPSSLVPSSSSSSSSSSTIPSKGWQNVGSKTMLSAPAVASSSSTSLPSSGPLPFNKGLVGKLPENHPNSAEAAERKDGSSAVVAKLTETYIQPTTLAFNRRAQQVAGRIYYWKHGNYHLVSEQDKQQWPGEWKFDVYQDPMVHEGPSLLEGSPGSSSSASYTGKGKLTDRQLSGPASKRARVHRESFGSFQEMASSSSGGGGSGGSGGSSVSGSGTIPQQQQHQDMELSGSPGVGHEREVTPPPSPISRVSKKHLQERYDFRERRMLNEPLTPRPRRCGA